MSVAAKNSSPAPPIPFAIRDTTQLEDWKKWQRSFRCYANSINLEQQCHDVQLCIFKSMVGPDALEIYNTFSLVDITDVESVIRKFDEHFKPKVNVTLERYKLYRLHQKSGQRFDDFLSDVTNQVDKCAFSSMRDEIVLYKLVGGIDNEEIRTALLADADLNYEKAVQICRASSAVHCMSAKEDDQRGSDKNKKEGLRKTPKVSYKEKRRSSQLESARKDQDASSEIMIKVAPKVFEAVDSENKDSSGEERSDGGDSDWRADYDCPDDYDDDNDFSIDPKVKIPKKRRRSKKRASHKNGESVESPEKDEKLLCVICDRSCRSRRDFQRHIMIHIPGEKVTCHHCGGRYKQKRYLVKHIVRSHPGIIYSKEPPKVFICEVCGYKTNQSANLRRHKYQHTDYRPFSCELCEYKCIVPRLMKAHMVKHTGEKPLVCSVCPKGFIEANALKKHMLSHLAPEEREKRLAEERESSCRPVGSTTATCDTCGKIFSSKSALKTHSVVHTGERPFACTVCDYRAGQKAALNAHMAKHSEEKPFVCTVCGYSCKLKRVLQVHMNTHTGDRPYACTMCDNRFKQIAHLQVHVRTHTGEKPYVCDICGHRWAKQSNLTQHMKVHQNQTGDRSQYTPPRKRQKKRKSDTVTAGSVPATDSGLATDSTQATDPALAPASAIPQWSEQVSTINPMECFLNLETPPPFHPTYPVPQGNPRPPDCRYFQQRQVQSQNQTQNQTEHLDRASTAPFLRPQAHDTEFPR